MTIFAYVLDNPTPPPTYFFPMSSKQEDTIHAHICVLANDFEPEHREGVFDDLCLTRLKTRTNLYVTAEW